MKTPRPNFLIVGAPKCGTTALHHCLRKHPEVFLPHSEDPSLFWRYKEPQFFCDDLRLPDWMRVSDEAEFFGLFKSTGAPLRGTASAMELFSPGAPQKIQRLLGKEVKIIILLRSPVIWMRSWHHDLLRYGYEDVADFRKALALGDERDAGRSLPKRPAFAGVMNYKRLAHFSHHVERYYEVFGRERVFVSLIGDMGNDASSLLVNLLEFLEVDSALTLELGRENDSGVLPGTHLFDLKVGRVVARIPGGEAVKALWQKGPETVYRTAISATTRPLSDKRIDPELERELKEEFRGEIAILGDLIGRDLQHWG